MPADLQELCVPERQVVGWFDIIDKEHFQPENFPVFIIHDDRGYYYGFPPFDNPGDGTASGPINLQKREKRRAIWRIEYSRIEYWTGTAREVPPPASKALQ